jgi:hypothetical protein
MVGRDDQLIEMFKTRPMSCVVSLTFSWSGFLVLLFMVPIINDMLGILGFLMLCNVLFSGMPILMFLGMKFGQRWGMAALAVLLLASALPLLAFAWPLARAISPLLFAMGCAVVGWAMAWHMQRPDKLLLAPAPGTGRQRRSAYHAPTYNKARDHKNEPPSALTATKERARTWPYPIDEPTIFERRTNDLAFSAASTLILQRGASATDYANSMIHGAEAEDEKLWWSEVRRACQIMLQNRRRH